MHKFSTASKLAALGQFPAGGNPTAGMCPKFGCLFLQKYLRLGCNFKEKFIEWGIIFLTKFPR